MTVVVDDDVGATDDMTADADSVGARDDIMADAERVGARDDITAEADTEKVAEREKGTLGVGGTDAVTLKDADKRGESEL